MKWLQFILAIPFIIIGWMWGIAFMGFKAGVALADYYND